MKEVYHLTIRGILSHYYEDLKDLLADLPSLFYNDGVYKYGDRHKVSITHCYISRNRLSESSIEGGSINEPDYDQIVSASSSIVDFH
jgi:hypothetical protein